jgi:DNA-binding response OmpR family regulator
MRLLIAEDEADLAEALAAFLEKNQYAVDTVHDGEDAYDYASNGDYDALILDIMMPKMDGLQVLKRLRQEGCTTPVMLLTAKGEREDRIVGCAAAPVQSGSAARNIK